MFTPRGRSGYPSAWKVILGPWMLVVIGMVYLWIGPSTTGFREPEAARIIFWHVPMAMLGLLWFVVGAYHGIRFLWGSDRRNLERDTRCLFANEVGLLCTVLATATGAVFAQIQWGAAWNWDPKQVSIVVLIAIYIAYFALRGAVTEPMRRATLSSAYAVFGAVLTPLLMYVIPNLPQIQSLHPAPDTLNEGLDLRWKLVYWLATIGFLGITAWVYDLRLRAERLEWRQEERMAQDGA